MQPNSTTYRFLLSAGGTGGHIFPAVSVADALKIKYPECEILFIGANGRMEMEKVPKAGYKIVGLNISGIERSFNVKLLLWPFKLMGSLVQAFKTIKKFKPQLAIGFGGFASGPSLYMSSMLGIKCLIQEQNSYAGITNKILAGKVEKICVAYDHMENYFPAAKVIKTGNPVRQDISQFVSDKQKGLSHFTLKSSFPTLFVFGGSQGAFAINEAVYSFLDLLLSNQFQLIWQCGSSFLPKAQKLVEEKNLGDRVKVFEFVYEMEMAYQAADIIVARSGALSISELCLVGKPVIFVPLPSAAEDHQTKNAMALVDVNAAVLVKNSEVKEKLFESIMEIHKDDSLKAELSKNIKSLAVADSTDRIINEIDKVLTA